jgi:hypothetical protein
MIDPIFLRKTHTCSHQQMSKAITFDRIIGRQMGESWEEGRVISHHK